jgi:hypothetical protein
MYAVIAVFSFIKRARAITIDCSLVQSDFPDSLYYYRVIIIIIIIITTFNIVLLGTVF